MEDHSPTSEMGRSNSNNIVDEPPAYEPPPDYESPPNYEEAIKLYKDSKKKKDDQIKIDLGAESNGKI